MPYVRQLQRNAAHNWQYCANDNDIIVQIQHAYIKGEIINSQNYCAYVKMVDN